MNNSNNISSQIINYILFHLSHHIELSDSLLDKFMFAKAVNSDNTPYIHIPVLNKEFDIDNIKWIDNIPVLFPLSDNDKVYTVSNKSIIFNHDLISSAFYLLSGKQEVTSDSIDSYGRYPYSESIQEKLNITHIPVVNYYFEWIIQGIEEFGKLNGVEVKRKLKNAPFTFALSHDIDLIDRYDHFHISFHLKEFLGFTKTEKSKAKALKALVKCTFEWAKGRKRENPWWNFTELLQIENELGIKSAFYFLPNHNYKVDSFYNLEEKRVVELMNDLISKDFEVGMHGPMASATDGAVMSKQINRLNKLISKPIVGNRQHNLSYKHPLTLQLLNKSGIKYDSTLGFAEHEGFRNSYCFPFKPFDFDKNKIIDLWEIPLTVMDATLFKYQKYSFEQATDSIENLISEIDKFGGVLSILWHNSYYDNDVIPGIEDFYRDILKMIMDRKPLAIIGEEIIENI